MKLQIITIQPRINITRQYRPRPRPYHARPDLAAKGGGGRGWFTCPGYPPPTLDRRSPLPQCGQKHRHLWKHYLYSYLRTWSIKIKTNSILFLTFFRNKKVLLRERKRHTARRVATPWGGTYLGCRGGTYLGRGYLPWLRGGVPTLAGGGVPTLAGGGGTYLGQGEGVPTLPGGGVPTLARWRGYLPWLGEGYLPWPGGGVPTLAGGRSTYLDWGRGYLPWLGVPTLARGRGTYIGRGYLPWPGGGNLPWPGSPPRCGQTNKLKLIPSPILRIRAVKMVICLEITEHSSSVRCLTFILWWKLKPWPQSLHV